MDKKLVQISKKLSWILRHGAAKSGLEMSSDGFVLLEDLLKHESFRNVSLEKIQQVIEENEKKRFEMVTGEDGRMKIKASQGHSIEVPDLELEEIVKSEQAPHVLHGTTLHAWKSIQKEGLSRMHRQHIHFCAGLPGSEQVLSGYRTSSQVIIHIDLQLCLDEGLRFFRSNNNVILSAGDATGCIHPRYFKQVQIL